VRFKAFLIVKDGRHGRLNFRRGRRKGRAGAAKGPKVPQPKIDFTGKEPLGKCPKCGGEDF